MAFNSAMCKYNDFDENQKPVDPVSFEIIPEKNLYVLNDRCYDKNTIRELLVSNNKDPIHREKIPLIVYQDFGIDPNYYLYLDLAYRNINDEWLKNNTFPNKLLYINLSFNNISDISRVIFPINLLELKLNNNFLTKINIKSKTLKILNLSNNLINNINLEDIPNLEDLNLENNKITIINIKSLTNLKTLNLNYNQLYIKDIEFSNSIQMLYLKNNKITNIDDIIFQNNLYLLDLSDNLLESVDNVIFPNSIEFLYLNGNNLLTNTVNSPRNLLELKV